MYFEELGETARPVLGDLMILWHTACRTASAMCA